MVGPDLKQEVYQDILKTVEIPFFKPNAFLLFVSSGID